MEVVRGDLPRTGLAYASVVGATAVLGPFIGATGFLGRVQTADRLIRWWSRALMAAFGVSWEVFGREHALVIGPCVLMSSHRSLLDGPLLLCALPTDFAFVIKQSLARVPVWGWAVTGAGYVAIDRRSPTDALAGMKQAAAAVRGGRRILTFPEGSRSPSDEFLPFKKGGAVLAIEAQVPVLPVAIAGTLDLLPRDCLTARSGRAMIGVGPPIATAGMTYDDRGALLGTVEAEVRRLYAEAQRRLHEGRSAPRCP